MVVKKIGTNPDNDIKIEDTHVSRYHAQLMQINEEEYIIEDLNSTNGTYVNGQKIKKVTVTVNDKIVLAEYDFDLAKQLGIKEPTIRTNGNYSEEFNKLKDVYQNYKDQKAAASKKYFNKNALVRTLIIVLPIGIYFGLGLYKDPKMGGMFFLFSCLFNAIGAWVKLGEKEYNTQQEEIEIDYLLKWTCPNPKCRQALPTRHWRIAKEQIKTCRHCKCQW
jgi:pSer/pThr/pTyr-binding forkhead associated (FHA) protein